MNGAKANTHHSRTKLKWIKKQYLVNEHFQFRFIAFSCATALIACLVFYGATLYFFAKSTDLALESGLQPTHPVFRALANMGDTLTMLFAVISVGVIAFTFVAGLVFSNRVAGPMFRMRTHFEKVARGETLDGLNFRKGDYFADVAGAYNAQMHFVRASSETTATDTETENSSQNSKKIA